MQQSSFIQPVRTFKESVLTKHDAINLYYDQPFVQVLYAELSSTALLTGTTQYGNRFSTSYGLSVSANYNLIARQFASITENGWSAASFQRNPGIWSLPSPTAGATQTVAQRVQQIKFSSYYYGDDIAAGSLKLYYYPIASSSNSVSAVQLQTTLKFFDVDGNTFGPSFAFSATPNLANLSASTSAFTVDMLWRPAVQSSSGTLWHRWTTDGSQIIPNYAAAAANATVLHGAYSAEPYFGVGAFFNRLVPVTESNDDKPYIDLCVYGALSSSTGNFVDLQTGLIAEATHTRFYLGQDILNRVYDGSFHHLRFVWSKNQYQLGKLYVDGGEITNYVPRGTGRSSDVSYSLNSSSCASPLYLMSKQDNTQSPSVQTSSKSTAFGECKYFIFSTSALTGVTIQSSVTSDSQVLSVLGSTSSFARSFVSFNQNVQPNNLGIVDRAFSLGLVGAALTGSIVNDVAAPHQEGVIGQVFSLLTDRSGNSPRHILNVQQNSPQQPVGFLYNSEYGEFSDSPIGVAFYGTGNCLVLGNYYNAQFGLTTQRFTESGYGSFSTSPTTAWQLAYSSFLGRRISMRRSVTITADSGYFCKSTSVSSLFDGKDGSVYTKSNKKYITGILWYGKDGRPLATTKFTTPLRKQEDTDMLLTVNFDF